ncbi:hypothetical protein F7725_015608 [Dissostichus mawsoni]|uniref:Calcineurin B homologous protein 3 n=1 Tax=Dissostichus mawsoni TaxID=36200 RepID=A0A7J5YJF6_DISMA|nr:hypothetical protein F7725_015608 [Dissostichus mawsoni]
MRTVGAEVACTVCRGCDLLETARTEKLYLVPLIRTEGRYSPRDGCVAVLTWSTRIRVLHKRFKLLSHNGETLKNFRQNGEGPVDEIHFEEFLMVMSHFKAPSPRMIEERESVRREKLRFIFNMHDTDNDGTITLEEYRHVIDELLSLSEALEKDTAKSIADAAMLEVASTSMGHMEPDEFYEGITFEHFLKLLKGFEIELKMNVHFSMMDTPTFCK